MDIPWPNIIRSLVDTAKLTQPEIARLCGCGQSTISDILRGNTTDPRTSTGLLLLGLAKRHGVYAPEWPDPAGQPGGAVAAPAAMLEAATPAAALPPLPVSAYPPGATPLADAQGGSHAG